MNNIEICIQLDPVKDGASWIPKDVRIKGDGALIIGTNGEYRIAKEDEAIEILDRMSGFCASEYIGKTSFLVVYNSKKVISTGEGKFIAGSVMIIKGSSRGIDFLDENEIEVARKEFESRIATLCGNGIQFSAYEI